MATLGPFLLQPPYKSKKSNYVTSSGLGVIALSGLRGFSDTWKVVSRGLRNIFSYLSEVLSSLYSQWNPGPSTQLAAAYPQILHYSSCFSLTMSHETPSVPRTLHALAHLNALAYPGLSAPNAPSLHLCLTNTYSSF